MLRNVDKSVADLITQEQKRQENVLEMIPSENYASSAVREAIGSVLTNKYSEGYSHKRYYQGNSYIDGVEDLAVERAKKLFGVPHANVQAYSGSPANSAVYMALLKPGDKIMGLKLSAGGHLTHGHPNITFSGTFYTTVQYDVDADGELDLESIAKMVKKEKPKILVVGTTAYPRLFDWKKWKVMADSVGALYLADISHIGGLIVGGAYPSPAPYADVLMCTTHKTLRGPRGAILMVTKNGLAKDPEMGDKIDKAVFPGLQGGPHDNTTAGIAVCLKEAESPAFKAYSKQIIKNANVLAEEFIKAGLKLTTGGTDSHLMVVDLRPQGVIGNVVAEALERASIVVNRNSVPHDTNPPFYPSGIRLGTPAITTRGLKEKEMKQIAKWIIEVVEEVKAYRLPDDKEKRGAFMKKTRLELDKSKTLAKISREVAAMTKRFPLP